MIRRLPVERGGERLCDLLKRIEEACDDRGIDDLRVPILRVV